MPWIGLDRHIEAQTLYAGISVFCGQLTLDDDLSTGELRGFGREHISMNIGIASSKSASKELRKSDFAIKNYGGPWV
jgi:hypothetical protein